MGYLVVLSHFCMLSTPGNSENRPHRHCKQLTTSQWARLADVYGRRLVFILGSLGVTIFTLVIPFSPNEIAFDVFRGLQGLGGAANVPTAIGILRSTFEPGSQSMLVALSIYSAGFPMGSVIGNILGGLVAEWASWKW